MQKIRRIFTRLVSFKRNRLDSDPFNFIPFVGSNRSAVHIWSPIGQILNRRKVNRSIFVSHPSSSSTATVELIGRPASHPPLQPLPSSLLDRLFQKNLASPWLNDFSFPNTPDNSAEAAWDFNTYVSSRFSSSPADGRAIFRYANFTLYQ